MVLIQKENPARKKNDTDLMTQGFLMSSYTVPFSCICALFLATKQDVTRFIFTKMP